MAEPLAAIFRKPFHEQVAAWRLRLGNRVPTSAWDELVGNQHDRAFVVAGARKADLLADLTLAVSNAIEGGVTQEAFNADFRALVEKHGWHGWTGEGSKKGEEWRMRTIYRTNLRTSYMAGRYAQLTAAQYPYWIYRHGGSLEPRLQHLSWDGLVLPSDHPFWSKHYPPNDWGCSCRVFGARSLDHARRKGGDPDKTLPPGWDTLQARTGTPNGIGKGWDYAPGSSVVETVNLAARKIASLPPELGVAYGESVAPLIDKAWPVWLTQATMKRKPAPALVGVIPKAALDVLKRQGAAPVHSEIRIKPSLLGGAKGQRHSIKGDAMSMADWLNLPAKLRQPRAILFDHRSGNLLFILDGEGGDNQLAIAINYATKMNREEIRTNMAVSAYKPSLISLLARLGSGMLSKVFGEIG